MTGPPRRRRPPRPRARQPIGARRAHARPGAAGGGGGGDRDAPEAPAPAAGRARDPGDVRAALAHRARCLAGALALSPCPVQDPYSRAPEDPRSVPGPLHHSAGRLCKACPWGSRCLAGPCTLRLLEVGGCPLLTSSPRPWEAPAWGVLRLTRAGKVVVTARKGGRARAPAPFLQPAQCRAHAPWRETHLGKRQGPSPWAVVSPVLSGFIFLGFCVRSNWASIWDRTGPPYEACQPPAPLLPSWRCRPPGRSLTTWRGQQGEGLQCWHCESRAGACTPFTDGEAEAPDVW